jgi:hypothetical protein
VVVAVALASGIGHGVIAEEANSDDDVIWRLSVGGGGETAAAEAEDAAVCSLGPGSSAAMCVSADWMGGGCCCGLFSGGPI